MHVLLDNIKLSVCDKTMMYSVAYSKKLLSCLHKNMSSSDSILGLFTPHKELNIPISGKSSSIITCKSYKLLEMVRFLANPVYSTGHLPNATLVPMKTKTAGTCRCSGL